MLLGGRVLWLLNDVIRDIHFSFFLSFLLNSIHMHIIPMRGRILACAYINFFLLLSMREISRRLSMVHKSNFFAKQVKYKIKK